MTPPPKDHRVFKVSVCRILPRKARKMSENTADPEPGPGRSSYAPRSFGSKKLQLSQKPS